MRLELVPVIFGVIVLLMAAGIIYDAAAPAHVRPFSERRRRQRAEIDTAGEWLVGLGIVCLVAELIGNELWRWSTIDVLSGGLVVVLLHGIGTVMNRSLFRIMLMFRGPARRTIEM